jgi:hypothetical protein
MYHYLTKLTFDLQRNNKLHIFNLHYYKFIFQNSYLDEQKMFASYRSIHLHK